ITVRSGRMLFSSVTLRSACAITSMHSRIGRSARTSRSGIRRVSTRTTMERDGPEWKSGTRRRIFARAVGATYPGGSVQLSIIGLNFVYAILGVVLMWVSYRVFDKLTHEIHFSDELKKGNVAVAIFIAAIFISIALIIGHRSEEHKS